MLWTKKMTMRERILKGEHTACYVTLIGLSIITMLIMAFNNSPLTKRMGEDGGIYLLMGKNMIDGGSLYKDLFDHKGPLIFVLNAIPQLFISGTVGVWVLEVVFMIASVVLLYKMAYKLICNKAAIILPLIYIGAMGLLMSGGNYTEEYGNLFVMISLYLFVIWKEEGVLSRSGAFTLGLCMALVFFMRPNNIVVIAVIVAYIGIYSMVWDRKYIFRYIIYGILGLGSVTSVIVIYHYCQGTLYDMLYATVLHNLQYCIVGNGDVGIPWYLYTPFRGWLWGINLIIWYAIIRCLIYKDKSYALFLGIGSVMSTGSILISGRQYFHYLMLILPLLALAVILIFVYATPDLKKYVKNEKKLRTCILALLIFMIVMDLNLVDVKQMRERLSAYKQDCVLLCDKIPVEERDVIFGYDIPAMWYYVNDVMPDYPYFTMQTWMTLTNSDIGTDILTYVKTEHPKWLVTYMEDAGTNKELRELILSDYEKVEQNSSGYLYRYKKS